MTIIYIYIFFNRLTKNSPHKKFVFSEESNLRDGIKRLKTSLWSSLLECIFLENRTAKFVSTKLLGFGLK